jgi:rubrerythrin
MAYSGSGIKDASPMEQLVMWLRDDLSGELDAINQYQWHIDNIENEEIKSVLAHIRDEEKEHMAELVKLISRIDEIQREKFLTEGVDMKVEPLGASQTLEEAKADTLVTIGSLKTK